MVERPTAAEPAVALDASAGWRAKPLYLIYPLFHLPHPRILLSSQSIYRRHACSTHRTLDLYHRHYIAVIIYLHSLLVLSYHKRCHGCGGNVLGLKGKLEHAFSNRTAPLTLLPATAHPQRFLSFALLNYYLLPVHRLQHITSLYIL